MPETVTKLTVDECDNLIFFLRLKAPSPEYYDTDYTKAYEKLLKALVSSSRIDLPTEEEIEEKSK